MKMASRLRASFLAACGLTWLAGVNGCTFDSNQLRWPVDSGAVGSLDQAVGTTTDVGSSVDTAADGSLGGRVDSVVPDTSGVQADVPLAGTSGGAGGGGGRGGSGGAAGSDRIASDGETTGMDGTTSPDGATISGGAGGGGGVTSFGGAGGAGGVTSSGGAGGAGGVTSLGGAGAGGVTSSGGAGGGGGVTSLGGAGGAGGVTSSGGAGGVDAGTAERPTSENPCYVDQKSVQGLSCSQQVFTIYGAPYDIAVCGWNAQANLCYSTTWCEPSVTSTSSNGSFGNLRPASANCANGGSVTYKVGTILVWGASIAGSPYNYFPSGDGYLCVPNSSPMTINC
jgi:hypothetical protein